MRIYVDIDGVLADFITGYCEKNCCDNPWVEDPNLKIERLEDALGKTTKELWRFCNSKNFWADLPKLPKADELIDQCFKFTDEVCIMSSPAPFCPKCCEGKLAWIEKHFPRLKDRFCFTRTKWMFAHKDAILIDDWWEQCNKFRDNGGMAILYPAINNILRDQYESFNLVQEIAFSLIMQKNAQI